jgi:glutathione S-transferase
VGWGFQGKGRLAAESGLGMVRRSMLYSRVSELARLIDWRRFAVADKFGLGDIAAGSVLGYLKVRFQEFDWQTLYPSLAEYSANLEQRPSFQQTIPYPQTIIDKVV